MTTAWYIYKHVGSYGHLYRSLHKFPDTPQIFLSLSTSSTLSSSRSSSSSATLSCIYQWQPVDLHLHHRLISNTSVIPSGFSILSYLHFQVDQHTTMASSAIISYADLSGTLHSIDTTVRWCRAKSLLPVFRDWGCGCSCRVTKHPRYAEGECFRCPSKVCQKQIILSFCIDTFF